MKKAFCFSCCAYRSFDVYSTMEKVTIRGVEFSYSEKRAYCTSCGEQVYVPKINDANVQAREDAFREQGDAR